jgi:hypothetical protein
MSELYDNPPYFAVTMPLYLAFRDEWLDLTLESQELGLGSKTSVSYILPCPDSDAGKS